MMRVLYDISALGLGHLYRQSRGGSYRVDLHVIEGLASSGECELLLCANQSSVAFRGCEAFLSGNQRLRAIPLISSGRSRGHARIRAVAAATHRVIRSLFRADSLPSPLRHVAAFVDRRLHPAVGGTGASIDVLHSPLTPRSPPANGRAPQRFFTIYDLAPLRFPGIYAGTPRERSMTAALRNVRSDDCVITTSQFGRDELCERGIASPDRIYVVPLAADAALFHRCDDPQLITAVRARYGIPEGPYVLSVNGADADPRKNVAHAIHAFARVAHEARDVMASLVLTGDAGASKSLRDVIAAYPALRGRIIFSGYVPDADLAPLYSGAQLFVYPSLYEGFGLPPLEAMQCGTAVITSNSSSLPEVVGDAGLMVAPRDIDALAALMLDVASDSGLRRRLQQRAVARARRFSWNVTTAAVLHAYRTALQA